MSLPSFAIGFVAGWLVRSSVESSRELAVDIASGSRSTLERLRRMLIAEEEFLEDLWAEAKTRVRVKEPPPHEAEHVQPQGEAPA